MQAECGVEGRLSLNGLLVWILMTDCKLLLTWAVFIPAAKWEIRITARCSLVCGGLWLMVTSARTHTVYTSLCIYIPYEDNTETDHKNAVREKSVWSAQMDGWFLWMLVNHQKHETMLDVMGRDGFFFYFQLCVQIKSSLRSWDGPF